MKKRLRDVTILLFAVLLLTACGQEEEVSQNPAAVTEEPQQNELFGKLNIGGTPLETFQIVRSDYSTKDVTKATLTLRNTMEEVFGVSMERIITTDWKDNEVLPHEIVVGKSERLAEEEYPETPAELGEKGFFIMERDGRIFIVGGADAGVSLGVERFIAEFVEGKDAVMMPLGYTYLSYHDYDIQTLTIAGRDIREFSIVIDEEGENEDSAKEFAALIASSVGVTLEIIKDASASPAIRMDGAELPVDGVIQVSCTNGELVFASTAQGGIAASVDAFCERYLIGAMGAFDIPAGFIYNDFTDSITLTMPNG